MQNAQGNYGVNYNGAAGRTGTADAFSLVLNGAGVAATPANFNTITAAGAVDNTFEVANITATGTASNVVLGNGVGAGNMTLRTVNVTGDAAIGTGVNPYGLTLTANGGFTDIRTVDASGMTGTGGLNIDLTANAQNVKFTGSAQNDRLAFDSVARLTNDDTIDFGEGKDILSLADAGAWNAGGVLTAAAQSQLNTRVKGYEVLELAGNITDLDTALINVNEFRLTGAAQVNAAITGVSSADTFVLTTDVTGAAASDALTFTGAGPGNTLNLSLTGGVDVTGANALADGAISIAGGITSLTIASTGTTANTIVGSTNAGAPTVGTAIQGGIQNVTITGTQAITIADGFNSTGAGSFTNGAAFDSSVSINAADLTGALRVAGSGQADAIVAGSGNDTIVATGGADTITLGAGTDTVIYTNINQSVLATRDTITDFNGAGNDVLNLAGVGGNAQLTAGQLTAVQTAVSNLGAGSTLAQALDAAANNSAVVNGVMWFEFGDNTYVYREAVGANTTYTDTDLVIELQGTGLNLSYTGDFVLA